jgi:ABC-2 type transport system ATP-binding protein
MTAPVIQAEALVRRFGQAAAVSGISLTVPAGELYGLVGPDGAGKSTTIRLLAGLLRPDGGTARVLGHDVSLGHAAAREAIGYMPQQYSLYGDLSIDENLRFFGQLFGLDRRTYAERRERLLHLTRLARFADRRADALSGGMYKKLALACALLHRPKVLLLDEPTNGVDPVSRRELWDLLYEFVSEGMAVLLATPYMDEAARCHRVGLIHGGTLLTEGRPADLTAAFPHATVQVAGPDRGALEAALDGAPGVLALTPHGEDLRVVVDRARPDAVSRALAGSGQTYEAAPVAPDFEDVFLGLLATRERGAA